MYGVDQSTLRQQMAVFLLKARFGVCYVPPPCAGTFPDVPCPSTFANWIEALSVAGITGGCGGGNYCPQNPVRRDQMAVFLLKTKYGSGYTPPACTGVFPDVACPSQFADWIEQLAEEQITGGCGGGNYCPLEPEHARTDGGVHHEGVQTPVSDPARWRDSSYRRGKRWPTARVRLGAAYCRGSACWWSAHHEGVQTPIETRSELRSLILLVAVSLGLASSAAAATITVTSTADSGAGTLRQAVLDSNASAGVLDTIEFAIPGGGVHTITITTTFPRQPTRSSSTPRRSPATRALLSSRSRPTTAARASGSTPARARFADSRSTVSEPISLSTPTAETWWKPASSEPTPRGRRPRWGTASICRMLRTARSEARRRPSAT